MSWFKTDDKLPDHRKARALRKSHPRKRRDVAPFGIWVLAGAWSDDGFVPLEVIEDWDDDAETLAARLVKAGLWHPTQRDGEPGYVFHDWADQNPARDSNDPSKSGSFGNHIRWHVQLQKVHPDCDHCPKEPAEDRPDIAPISPRLGGDIAPDVENDRPESLPSRPDPTRTRPEPGQLPSSTDVDGPTNSHDRFEEFWDAYGHKVGRKSAQQKWRIALKKPGVTADMLIAAASAYVTWERANNEGGRFIKHPTTWLNGEHWTDERVGRAPQMGRAAQWLQLAADLGPEDPTIRQIGSGR